MIKAIIYDLDDTLYPEASFQRSGFKAVTDFVKKYNLRITVNDLFKIYRRHPKNSFDMLIDKFNLPLTAGVLTSLYLNHKPAISPFKDTEATLTTLKKKYFLGILTDYYKKTQENKIESLNISKYFDRIVYTDVIGAPKPQNKGFMLLKKASGSGDGEIIYVADNEEKDFIGARDSGFYTVKLNKQGFYSKKKMPKEYNADFEINKHNQILKILAKLDAPKTI